MRGNSLDSFHTDTQRQVEVNEKRLEQMRVQKELSMLSTYACVCRCLYMHTYTYIYSHLCLYPASSATFDVDHNNNNEKDNNSLPSDAIREIAKNSF